MTDHQGWGELHAARPSRRTGRARSPAASARWCGSSASSSRGRATRYARHCAREIATFRRLREKRNSSPRGTSSPLELAIEKKTTGACWPWNLSTVPMRTRRSGMRLAQAANLRVVRRDDDEVVRRAALVAPSSSRTASRAAARSRRATASASSGDALPVSRRARPGGSGGRSRPRADRSSAPRAGCEPALVERRRDEVVQTSGRIRQVLLEEEAHLRPHRLVARRAGARARRRPRPAGASPARPAAAGSGRRAGRGSAPRSRPRARRRARTGPPSSMKSVSTCWSSSSREKSQDVPASSWSSSSSMSSFDVGAVDELVPSYADSSPLALLQPAEREARPRRAASSTSSRNLWIALWLSAVTPTRCPACMSAIAIRAPFHVLPEPGGPWTKR